MASYRRTTRTFSNCHEFLGESTISFDEPSEINGAETPNAPGSQDLIIPAGLPLHVALTQAIDTAKAAAGDLIKGKLTAPIRDGSKVLVPAGAAIGVRIVRIRQFYGAAPSVRLEFGPETVDVGGVSLPLIARPENGNNFPKADPANLQRRIELGNLRGLQDRSVEFVFRGISLPYIIQSGLESGWVTAAPTSR